jgi:hypothetical protein
MSCIYDNNDIYNNSNYENININSPCFIQTQKYKKYKNKIFKGKIKNKKVHFQEKISFGTEAFSPNMNLSKTNITKEGQNILNRTRLSSSQIQINLERKEKYNLLLDKYRYSVIDLTFLIDNYLSTLKSNTPYLGKNIRFWESGAIYYVTLQGEAKFYPSMEIFYDTINRNGCPSVNWVNMTIPWSDTYLIPGTIIPSDPPLIVGSPMVAGESCGLQSQLIPLLDEINLLEDEINSLALEFSQENINLENEQSLILQQSKKDKQLVIDFLKDFKYINDSIEKIDNQHTLLNETNINVLQKNYNYLLWSILAIGIVIIGINVIKKKPNV